MKHSKNRKKLLVISGFVLLLSAAFIITPVFSVSCRSHPKQLDAVITKNYKNITAEANNEILLNKKRTYYNNLKPGFFYKNSPAFLPDYYLNSKIDNTENYILVKTLKGIMHNIENSGKYYEMQKAQNNFSHEDSNYNEDVDKMEEIANQNHKETSTEITESKSTENKYQLIDKDSFINEIFILINNARIQKGLSPLNSNNALNGVASFRSQDMIDRDYFSHITPEGKSCINILQESGVAYNISGENIIHSFPPSNADPYRYFNTWMDSDLHRANILNSYFSQIGIGISFNNERVVTVAVFTG